MELALSLGNRGVIKSSSSVNFCMGLTPSSSRSTADINPSGDHDHHKMITNDDDDVDVDGEEGKKMEKIGSSSSCDPTAVVSPRQLDLLPLSPVPRTLTTLPSPPLRFPWLSENLSSEPGSSDGPGQRTMEVERRQMTAVVGGPAAEDGDAQSSPNSGTSSFMEFSLYTSSNNGKRSNNNNNNNNNVVGVIVGGGGEQVERGATTSRGSDDEENGSTRKKLRLSKEQSAFLEESFKEHHTLNPKQKQALAKELNLRPRQVEVWFQNRRARTKLKQTEVDCEYLKRCCETLTEENRRLQKELHDLRALKTSQPFFMQLPATTLTMCPSCERVAPTSTSAAKPVSPSVAPSAGNDDDDHDDNGTTLSLGKPNNNNSNNDNNNNNSNLPFCSNTPTKTC